MTQRPVVLLDMDGPLADFDLHFWNRCSAAGITLDVDCHTKQRHRYFTEHIPNRRERSAARAMVDAAGWFAELPVTPGAIEGVADLMERFDVWVCTKPLEANPTCRDDKGRWLAEHFPMLEERLIIAPDKSRVAGAILLDDAPKIEWMERAVWMPVIFDAPYNRDAFPGVWRWKWGDDIDIFTSMVGHAASTRHRGLST